MILVDASVLVQYLRAPSPAVREVLASTDCGLCGVTRAEILHGVRTPDDAERLALAMNIFTQVPTPETVWDHLGRHLALLRARGLPMPFQDVLLAAIVIEHDAAVWSYDAHLASIKTALPTLKLFEGPAGTGGSQTKP